MKKRLLTLLLIAVLCTGLAAPAVSLAGTVILPSSLTEIGAEAFYGDQKLTAVYLTGSISTVGASAFRNCTGLTSLNISAGVSSIGDYAFKGCTSLENVMIGGKTITIGKDAFDSGTVIHAYSDSTARTWAENNSCLWMPFPGQEILTQPQDVTADPGETVQFTVSAQGVRSYQWQFYRSDMGWANTYLPGYDTASLQVQANVSRTVMKWRCQMTLNDDTVIYTNAAQLSLSTVDLNDIQVTGTSSIQYDVPLYDQESYGICWSVSMQMVEDFMLGIEHSTSDALELSIERAQAQKGDDWDMGYWPYDVNDKNWPASDSAVFTDIYKAKMKGNFTNATEMTAENLYQILTLYGPAYLTYGLYEDTTSDRISGHVVVLTGIDVESGTVYTNNPWEVYGEQTWDEAMAGFDTGYYYLDDYGTWMLEYAEGVRWDLWYPDTVQ